MITFEEAKTILTPFIQTIEKCIADAIVEYNNIDSNLRSKFYKRTRANIINDLMVFNATRELENIDNVLFSYRHQQFCVVIGDSFKLKFKKLNHRLRPSNIITKQVFKFMNQMQIQLPDMPSPITNIVAGYIWNDLQTAIRDIYIVCPNGKNNEWELKISAEKSPEVFPVEAIENELVDMPIKRVFPKDINDLNN